MRCAFLICLKAALNGSYLSRSVAQTLCSICFKITVLKDRTQATQESSLKRSSALTLDCGGALMVQIQSKASPGFTRSSSSTWLERIIPSHPLISNWQSVERQRKCGGEVRIKKKGERTTSRVKEERWQGGQGGRNNKEWKRRETGQTERRMKGLVSKIKDFKWNWREHRGLEERTRRRQRNKGRKTGSREQDQCVNSCMCLNLSINILSLHVQPCARQGAFVCSAFTSDAEISSGKLPRREELFKKDRTPKNGKILKSLPGMGFSSPPTCRWKSGSEMIRFGKHITLNPHGWNW